MLNFRTIVAAALFSLAFAAAAGASMPTTQWDPTLTYEGNWIYLFERLYTPNAPPYRDDELIPDVNAQWGTAMQGDALGNGYNSTPSWQGYWALSGVTKQMSGLSLSTKISAWLNGTPLDRGIRYSVRQETTPLYPAGVNNSTIVNLSPSKEYWEMGMGPLGFSDPWATKDTNVAEIEVVDDLNYGGELGPLRAKWDFYNTIWQTQTQGTRYWTGDKQVSIPYNQNDRNVYWAFARVGYFDAGGNILAGKPPLYQLQTIAEMGSPFTFGSVAGGSNVGAHSTKGLDWASFVKGSGYMAHPTVTVDNNGAQSGEVYASTPTYSGGAWYLPVTIDSVQYNQRFDVAYDEANFLTTSGTPFQWHDDHALFLAGYIAVDVPSGNYGQSGRYVTMRGRSIAINVGAYIHEADIAAELRTYNPTLNPDGPYTPYQWLYDASGDMYTPLSGYTPRPDITDPEVRRATELVANTMGWAAPLTTFKLQSAGSDPPNTTSRWYCYNTLSSRYYWRTYDGRGSGVNHINHPVYGGIDDSSQNGMNAYYNATSLGFAGIPGVWYTGLEVTANLEADDYNLGVNRNNGKIKDLYFEHAWKIAGIMLGDQFWNSGYVWSNELGCVATRTFQADQFLDLGFCNIYMPWWTWNGSAWVTSTEYPAGMTRGNVWGWVDNYTDTAVAGHDLLNTFMRYVMDIDALVVEDVNGNGVFDVGEDYVMFSLVDDGLFKKVNYWNEPNSNVGKDAFFNGQYFNGDTIFVYDGTTVSTYFDVRTGIFFGQSIGTTAGLNSTLWAYGFDIDALDLWVVVPEPTSIFLILGTAVAFGSHVIRKRLGRS